MRYGSTVEQRAALRHTERVPQNQRELGNLFSLFTELQERALARVLVQEIGNVLQRPAVVLGHGRLEGIVLGMGLGHDAGGIVRAGNAIVVLLLSDVGSSGRSLGVVLVRRLLVHPGRVGLRILVVSVDVRIGHHLGCWEQSSVGWGMRWKWSSSQRRWRVTRPWSWSWW